MPVLTRVARSTPSKYIHKGRIGSEVELPLLFAHTTVRAVPYSKGPLRALLSQGCLKLPG